MSTEKVYTVTRPRTEAMYRRKDRHIDPAQSIDEHWAKYSTQLGSCTSHLLPCSYQQHSQGFFELQCSTQRPPWHPTVAQRSSWGQRLQLTTGYRAYRAGVQEKLKTRKAHLEPVANRRLQPTEWSGRDPRKIAFKLRAM